MARRTARSKTRRRRVHSPRKIGFDTDIMINVGIASLLVQKAPEILNKFLFADNPLTGQTASLVGVGAAYLYGMMTDNNLVANAGIALGILGLADPLIKQVLGDAGLIPSSYYSINDYGRIEEYTATPYLTQQRSQYKDSY
jgi:hypothetical protein